MTRPLRRLEPFPSFIDLPLSNSPAPSPTIFSLVAHNLPPRKPRLSTTQRVADNVRKRYYQYEVTFALYMMTPGEKMVFNTLVLAVFGLLAYGLYRGLEGFVINSVCQLVYYSTGSLVRVEALCVEHLAMTGMNATTAIAMGTKPS